MTAPASVIDFKSIIHQFLEIREWEDEIQYNENTEEWYVNTGVSIGEHSGRLIVEGRDKTGILGLYFYFLTKCKEAKIDEMAKVTNWANYSSFLGNFECLPDGTVRWKLKFDCENSALSGLGLSQNVQHGWDVVGTYADVIMAVAFTKTSAEDAINEFEAAIAAD